MIALVAAVVLSGLEPDGGFTMVLPDGGTPAPAVAAWRVEVELEPDAGFTLELLDVVVLPTERAELLGAERRYLRAKNLELQRTPPVLVSSEFWWWVLGFAASAATGAFALAWYLADLVHR